MEMQPKTIPESAEKGEWNMKEIVRVINLDLSGIDIQSDEDNAIQWDKFADQVIPRIMEQIREKMAKLGTKFPIILQTSVKAVCNRLGPEESTFYKNYRTNSMSNIKHVANNFEQVESILRNHLK
jgi:hypothetical protein